jgi:hypothetical protein
LVGAVRKAVAEEKPKEFMTIFLIQCVFTRNENEFLNT